MIYQYKNNYLYLLVHTIVIKTETKIKLLFEGHRRGHRHVVRMRRRRNERRTSRQRPPRVVDAAINHGRRGTSGRADSFKSKSGHPETPFQLSADLTSSGIIAAESVGKPVHLASKHARPDDEVEAQFRQRASPPPLARGRAQRRGSRWRDGHGRNPFQLFVVRHFSRRNVRVGFRVQHTLHLTSRDPDPVQPVSSQFGPRSTLSLETLVRSRRSLPVQSRVLSDGAEQPEQPVLSPTGNSRWKPPRPRHVLRGHGSRLRKRSEQRIRNGRSVRQHGSFSIASQLRRKLPRRKRSSRSVCANFSSLRRRWTSRFDGHGRVRDQRNGPTSARLGRKSSSERLDVQRKTDGLDRSVGRSSDQRLANRCRRRIRRLRDFEFRFRSRISPVVGGHRTEKGFAG